MPHQCVRCGEMYQDGASEILEGCSCGSKLFFFVKKEKLKEVKSMTSELSSKEKKQIEKDVFDIIGSDYKKRDEPVILDFESIRSLKPGKFELDLINLFNKKNPFVVKAGEGKYIIDVPGTFKKSSEVSTDDFSKSLDIDKNK